MSCFIVLNGHLKSIIKYGITTLGIDDWCCRYYRKFMSLERRIQTAPQPFLSLPFERALQVEITEGWFYSEAEKEIHGHTTHYGVDFAADPGTPVLAAADGFAIASFQTNYSGEYKGKEIGFGFGLFVKIWHPGPRIFSLYGHLQAITNSIPYVEPAHHQNDTYSPNGLHRPVAQLIENARPVKCGEVIGYIGTSGLSWGQREHPNSSAAGVQVPSWDEPHLHFEIYKPDKSGYQRKERFDPYAIYGTYNQYKVYAAPQHSLWLLDGNGKPKHA